MFHNLFQDQLLLYKCSSLKIMCLFPLRLENAMQLVRLFHQSHPDLPSSQYVAANQLNGFEELWVSHVLLRHPPRRTRMEEGADK